MYLRRSTTIKYLVAAYLGAALHCEWFVYILQPVTWPSLECQAYDSSCTKILFVADPQIQGDYAVPAPLSYLFNWDSDRYLKKTFSVVSQRFRPDVVVYLGDLMDEGSISTIPQFHGYVKRLANIFDMDFPVMQIWVPGDNDIGGEGEPIRKDKLFEFGKIFDQPNIVMLKNISFYKVNAITHHYPRRPIKGDQNFRIVVSHYPITANHAFGLQINKAISPNIYFCAHEHESKYVQQVKDLKYRETTWLKEGDDMLNIQFNDESLYEVYVPTCSYRMGTNKIGYGAAILENNNQHMRYTVFWSSRRFPYLFLYLALLIFLFVYFCIFCAAKIFFRHTQISGRATDKIPLLEKA